MIRMLTVTSSRARLHPAAYKAYARSQSLRVCLSILHQCSGGVFVFVQRGCRSGTVHWASYTRTLTRPLVILYCTNHFF
jgi:hypothetical protein